MVKAAVEAAAAEEGFLPRFLGAVCNGGGIASSNFLFLPGRPLVTGEEDTA